MGSTGRFLREAQAAKQQHPQRQLPSRDTATMATTPTVMTAGTTGLLMSHMGRSTAFSIGAPAAVVNGAGLGGYRLVNG